MRKFAANQLFGFTIIRLCNIVKKIPLQNEGGLTGTHDSLYQGDWVVRGIKLPYDTI